MKAYRIEYLPVHPVPQWRNYGVAYGKKAARKALAELREASLLIQWRVVSVETIERVKDW